MTSPAARRHSALKTLARKEHLELEALKAQARKARKIADVIESELTSLDMEISGLERRHRSLLSATSILQMADLEVFRTYLRELYELRSRKAEQLREADEIVATITDLARAQLGRLRTVEKSRDRVRDSVDKLLETALQHEADDGWAARENQNS
jgi:oligoribonuclease (3'-5' exoribonuclease)